MGSRTAEWNRDTALIEYQSIKPSITTCPTKHGKYYHDGNNNTYSAIRIISDHENLLYAEFTDVTNPAAWTFAPETINFRELYNFTVDPYMLKNLYNDIPESLQSSLSSKLQRAIACKGRMECTYALSLGPCSQSDIV